MPVVHRSHRPPRRAACAGVESRPADLLRDLRILDSAPEASFDGLTRAAALLTGCPMALVSLLVDGRPWVKSRFGLAATETPSVLSFCALAARQPDLLEVEDAWADPRFANHPWVTCDPRIRFCAGQPLMLGGVCLGTLCAFDTQPRRLSAPVREALLGLAHVAQALIEARQSLVALGEQQQRLTDIALASGDWLWESDAQNQVIWRIAHETEADENELLSPGSRLPDGPLLDPQGEPQTPPLPFHRLLAQQGKITRATLRPVVSDAATCVSISALPYFGVAGEWLGFRGTARDVTAAVADERQRRAADIALRAERDAAQQAARLRSEVVSSVSHELRTPLNAVVGFAQLLLIDPQQVTLYASHIQRAGTLLLALVNDMLELARLETGHARMDLRPVSSASLMQRCVDLLEPEANRRGVQMHAHADPGADVVMAQMQGLTQAILNLASNALKFSPPGSTVRLHARVGLDEGHIEIGVSDQGPGIAPELLSLLFLPFSQLPGNRAKGGTGLGLAISRQLLQAMGGEISVQSVVGQGSSFTITLRASEPGMPFVPESAFGVLDESAAPPSATLLRVLYIEDDPVNVLLLEHMLAHFGPLNMSHAATAAAGRLAAQGGHFDLILLDMNLPDGHGLDLLAQLRASTRNDKVLIVALSADALPTSISAARAAGFDDYLTKPITMAVLERLVAKLR